MIPNWNIGCAERLEYSRDLWDHQSGRCGCCGHPFRDNTTRTSVLDHDHVTGVIRHLICVSCNHIVGRLELGRPCKSKKRPLAEAYIALWKPIIERIVAVPKGETADALAEMVKKKGGRLHEGDKR